MFSKDEIKQRVLNKQQEQPAFEQSSGIVSVELRCVRKYLKTKIVGKIF